MWNESLLDVFTFMNGIKDSLHKALFIVYPESGKYMLTFVLFLDLSAQYKIILHIYIYIYIKYIKSIKSNKAVSCTTLTVQSMNVQVYETTLPFWRLSNTWCVLTHASGIRMISSIHYWSDGITTYRWAHCRGHSPYATPWPRGHRPGEKHRSQTPVHHSLLEQCSVGYYSATWSCHIHEAGNLIYIRWIIKATGEVDWNQDQERLGATSLVHTIFSLEKTNGSWDL